MLIRVLRGLDAGQPLYNAVRRQDPKGRADLARLTAVIPGQYWAGPDVLTDSVKALRSA